MVFSVVRERNGMEKLSTRSLAVPVPADTVHTTSGGPNRINRFLPEPVYMDQHVRKHAAAA